MNRIAIVAAVVALSACTPAPAPQTPAASSAPPQREMVAPRVALAGLGAEQLRARGRMALREQRLYAPAGDNAIEYYLALRKASATPDAAAESALIDLQPYAVIAAEQAIVRKDFDEADRLRGLIATADPTAPSLDRITHAIESGRRALAEQARLAAETPAVPVTPVAPAPTNAPEPPRAAATVAATPPIASPPAAPPSAPAVNSPPAPRPVVSVPAPAPTKVLAATPRDAVAVRAPQPPYPPEERRFGTTAEVKATFTVLADGSVGDVDVESIGSRRVAFERNVRNTLKRWQFEPTGQSQSVTRVFTFVP